MILAVALIALISGGLHLDGLADTADALAAGDPERAEIARKDPSTGPAGVTAIVLVLGIQVAALGSLASGSLALVPAAALVAGSALGRTMPVLAATVVQVRGRAGATPRDGFGAWFVERVGTRDALVAIGLAALVVGGAAVVAAEPRIAVAAVVGAGIGGAATTVVAWRRGALDGDGLGAAVELTLAGCLGATALLI